MTIALVSHPDCILHEAGEQHPEQPARVQVIQGALEHYPFSVPVRFYEAPRATPEQLMIAHGQNYVNWILSIAPKSGFIQIDADTWMNPYTLNAALRAAGAVPFAVDLVMRGEAEAAFCNVRPPGHHAEREQAMGFCLFNNVAIGVKHALTTYGLERVAIIDFDVHHGNGTQDIFQNDKNVMYCSSFEHPFYPGYEPEMDNEHILSVPLAPGTRGEEFREKVQAAWFDKIAAFQPQFIFFSAGFDAHAEDPLADLELTREDYVWVTRQIAKIAKVHCDGRIVSALEGGYNLDALAQCVPAHVNALVFKPEESKSHA
ncbi:Histone deacetylase-like amidohydrolase [Aquicella siphonis]|uniref:Histone deacetylase-like amidohydrolase n=1 Tax=Aquicella siphonis TaxID=254247 RepID=A0A5E4PJQ3_9COXI|nr:histone deacetylase family protein [Aquicella siphonis]VVC76526.1 Histone deacetylase-like amidohydrolase [Aquicella siphonis]